MHIWPMVKSSQLDKATQNHVATMRVQVLLNKQLGLAVKWKWQTAARTGNSFA